MEVENMQIGQSTMSLNKMRSKICFLSPAEITMNSSNYLSWLLSQHLKEIMLFILELLPLLETRSGSEVIRLLLESSQPIWGKQSALSSMGKSVPKRRIWKKLYSVFPLMFTRKTLIEIARVHTLTLATNSSLELSEPLRMLASQWQWSLQLWQKNSGWSLKH